MSFSPTGLLYQATVGVTLLLERSKLVESHWSNQWLTSENQLLSARIGIKNIGYSTADFRKSEGGNYAFCMV